MKLTNILKEIKIQGIPKDEEIIDLWLKIFDLIEEYWEDIGPYNNQDIVLNLEVEVGNIDRKYFDKYDIEISDSIDDVDLQYLSNKEKRNYYLDLTEFYNKILK